MGAQNGWRWCDKCQGLFYSGNPTQGVCPGQGSHDASQSGRYAPLFGDGIPGAQDGWRWCKKCEGMFYAGNPSQGACPGQGLYQVGWRWCYKCQGMFYAGNPSQGVCPADHGAHDPSQSGHYAALFGDGAQSQQAGWRWCQKCQSMFYAGNPSQGTCPADNQAHDPSQSGHYAALFGNDAQGQQGGWRWCHKCQGMFYAGNPSQGTCPADNQAHDPSQSGYYAAVWEDGAKAHDASASAHYSLQWGDTVPATQGLWRWCQKCQGLFFSGNPSQGPCPAGGLHDSSASGQYGLAWEEIVLQTGPIAFGGGVPVGGWANLSMYPDGSYNFSGNFHDSGIVDFSAAIVWAVKSSSGKVFTFSQAENMGGAFGGSRDGTWNLSGTNAAIASDWNNLWAASPGYTWQAGAALDFGPLWTSIKSAIGVISEVVAIIGPLFAA